MHLFGVQHLLKHILLFIKSRSPLSPLLVSCNRIPAADCAQSAVVGWAPKWLASRRQLLLLSPLVVRVLICAGGRSWRVYAAKLVPMPTRRSSAGAAAGGELPSEVQQRATPATRQTGDSGK